MVNGDALLMAGYLCHYCLPDICRSSGQKCVNIADLTGVTGLNPAKASLECRDQVTVVSNDGIVASGLGSPIDLARHPATGELWAATRAEDLRIVDSQRTMQDRAPFHYMGGLSAFAFDEHGLTLTTCQDSKNDYWGHFEPNFFMGPSLYEVYPCSDGAYGRPAWSSNGEREDTPVAEAPWSVAEWAVALRLDNPRATVLVRLLG